MADARELVVEVARDAHFLDAVDALAGGLFLVIDRGVLPPCFEGGLGKENCENAIVLDDRMVPVVSMYE